MSRLSPNPLPIRFAHALASVEFFYLSIVCALLGSLIYLHGIVVEEHAIRRHTERGYAYVGPADAAVQCMRGNGDFRVLSARD